MNDSIYPWCNIRGMHCHRGECSIANGCWQSRMRDGSVEPEAAAALVDPLDPREQPMSEAIIAKMYLAEATALAYNQTLVNVTLRVVSRGEENKSWCASTPSGELKLSIANPAAQAIFLGADTPLGAAVNQEYEITIRRISDPAPA